jgi:pimeloyl-ACP methyl ester carboxylesterase
VVTIRWPEQTPAMLPLDRTIPDQALWDFSDTPKEVQQSIADARPHLHEELFQSPALSAFWGRPIMIKAWVLTPPGYGADGKATYPTVYETGGFGSTHKRDIAMAGRIWALEADKSIPPMIWVFLDHSSLGTGTTEFADSLNNGPWGHALTTELIPSLEKQYRMDAKPSGRFLTGHSSGGWATLWLQVRYPKLFGGTWSTSPDPSDFHDFTGADLTAPNANFYRDSAGKPRPLIRDHDKLIATIPDFARLEAVLGRNGGQFRSFEWVFSPRGPDGTPMEMYDRTTGAVNPAVVSYWRDHYDIAHMIETRWPELRPDLDGKVHLIVGTADTFYLDGAAHRLDAAMKKAGAHAQFTYIPNKTHFDLYERDGDKRALTKDIAKAMYATARPEPPATARRPARKSPRRH